LPRLIPFFSEKFPDVQVDIVAASPSYAAKLNEEFSTEKVTIYGELSANEMAELMRKADVAVTGSGQIIHELMAMGLPFVPVCIDDDQRPNIQFLQKHFLISQALMWSDERLEAQLERALLELADVDIRRSFCQQMQQLIDGKGGERLAAAIKQQYVKKRYQKVAKIEYYGLVAQHFSELSDDEKREILKWRNHPRVASQMRNTVPISKEQHFQFIENLPENPSRFYWRISSKDKRLGVFYLTHLDSKTEEAELGIYKNPLIMDKVGIVLMKFLIHVAQKYLQLQALYLEVRVENRPALELYRKMHFLPLKEKDGFILMKRQLNEERI